MQPSVQSYRLSSFLLLTFRSLSGGKEDKFFCSGAPDEKLNSSHVENTSGHNLLKHKHINDREHIVNVLTCVIKTRDNEK